MKCFLLVLVMVLCGSAAAADCGDYERYDYDRYDQPKLFVDREAGYERPADYDRPAEYQRPRRSCPPCRCERVDTANSTRQQLLLDAEEAGVASRFDQRFLDGLGLDDENELLLRLEALKLYRDFLRRH